MTTNAPPIFYTQEPTQSLRNLCSVVTSNFCTAKMADSNGAPAQDMANLHLDEVTGERVSKSELKKRQKQRQAEEKKREKAAAAPPKSEKKGNAELDESNLNPNV